MRGVRTIYGLEKKLDRIADGFDDLIGAVNAREASDVNTAIQVARLETKVDSMEKNIIGLGQSQHATNKVLIGMAVSFILAVLGAMLKGVMAQ